MGNRWFGRLVVVTTFASMQLGCYEPSAEAVARAEMAKAHAKEMDAQLDGLEERLLGNQAKVQLWRELGARHRNVSAIACENVATHVVAMEKHVAKQDKKARKLRSQRMDANVEHVSATPRQGRKSRSN